MNRRLIPTTVDVEIEADRAHHDRTDVQAFQPPFAVHVTDVDSPLLY
jgi:hypothetical protein